MSFRKMRQLLRQVFFFVVVTTFSTSMARPTLPNPFSTKEITINLGPGIGIERTVYLYSKSSRRFIRINNNTIDGNGSRSDPKSKLVLESVGFNSQVRIKSFDGSRYLCMSGHGSLVAENKTQGKILDRCIFCQIHHPKGYTVYRSKMKATWYLGIRRNGAPKSAKKTLFSQRATHFLELR